MKLRSLIALAGASAVAAVVMLPRPARPAPPSPSLPYKCIALGTLGGNWSTSNGVNDLGEVVGYSSQTGNSIRNINLDERAFYWRDVNGNNFSDAGEMVFLGSLGYNSTAFAISNGGEAVGVSKVDNVGPSRAILWNVRSDPRTMTDLNSLLSPADQATWLLTIGRDINQNRQVTGQAVRLSDSALRGFVFDLNTGELSILDPLTRLSSNAKSLNNLAPPQAVGSLSGNSLPSSGFFFNGAMTSDLAPLVYGIGVNDSNEVAGTVNGHPAYWKDTNGNGIVDGTELVDLGLLGPAASTAPYGEGSAINNSHWLVGNTSAAKKVGPYVPQVAIRWQAGTPITAKQDLNKLTTAPWTLTRALDISDAGMIVGWGNGSPFGYALTANDRAYILKPN